MTDTKDRQAEALRADIRRCLNDVATQFRATGCSDSRFVQLIARMDALHGAQRAESGEGAGVPAGYVFISETALRSMIGQDAFEKLKAQCCYPLAGAPDQDGTGVAEAWRPMGSAPRDGTMLRLLVEFTEHATEDSAEPSPTIGANNFDNDGEDEWKFAGWCWTHDHFTQGEGKPVGWLPMLAAAPEKDHG